MLFESAVTKDYKSGTLATAFSQMSSCRGFETRKPLRIVTGLDSAVSPPTCSGGNKKFSLNSMLEIIILSFFPSQAFFYLVHIIFRVVIGFNLCLAAGNVAGDMHTNSCLDTHHVLSQKSHNL